MTLDPSPLHRNGSYHCVECTAMSYMSSVCAWRLPRTRPSTCAAYWSRTVDIVQAPNGGVCSAFKPKLVACLRFTPDVVLLLA